MSSGHLCCIKLTFFNPSQNSFWIVQVGFICPCFLLSVVSVFLGLNASSMGNWQSKLKWGLRAFSFGTAYYWRCCRCWNMKVGASLLEVWVPGILRTSFSYIRLQRMLLSWCFECSLLSQLQMSKGTGYRSETQSSLILMAVLRAEELEREMITA